MSQSASFDYLKKLLNLPELTLDDDGCCVLTFDEVPITVQVTPDAIVLTSYVTQLGKMPSSYLLKQLLAANLYWNTTKGCTLALEPQSMSVLAQIKLTEYVAGIEKQLTDLLHVTSKFRNAIIQFEENFDLPTSEQDTGENAEFSLSGKKV